MCLNLFIHISGMLARNLVIVGIPIDHLCKNFVYLLNHILFLWQHLQDFIRFISFAEECGWRESIATTVLWNLGMFSVCSETFLKTSVVKLAERRPISNIKMWFCFSICVAQPRNTSEKLKIYYDKSVPFI